MQRPWHQTAKPPDPPLILLSPLMCNSSMGAGASEQPRSRTNMPGHGAEDKAAGTKRDKGREDANNIDLRERHFWVRDCLHDPRGSTSAVHASFVRDVDKCWGRTSAAQPSFLRATAELQQWLGHTGSTVELGQCRDAHDKLGHTASTMERDQGRDAYDKVDDGCSDCWVTLRALWSMTNAVMPTIKRVIIATVAGSYPKHWVSASSAAGCVLEGWLLIRLASGITNPSMSLLMGEALAGALANPPTGPEPAGPYEQVQSSLLRSAEPPIGPEPAVQCMHCVYMCVLCTCPCGHMAQVACHSSPPAAHGHPVIFWVHFNVRTHAYIHPSTVAWSASHALDPKGVLTCIVLVQLWPERCMPAKEQVVQPQLHEGVKAFSASQGAGGAATAPKASPTPLVSSEASSVSLAAPSNISRHSRVDAPGAPRAMQADGATDWRVRVQMPPPRVVVHASSLFVALKEDSPSLVGCLHHALDHPTCFTNQHAELET
eukprot:1159697-Pelagomonas_calceolata.AAC.2